MSEQQRLAASIAAFLRSPRAAEGLSADAAEGLTVAAQCVETSYGLTEAAISESRDLVEVWRAGNAGSWGGTFVAQGIAMAAPPVSMSAAPSPSPAPPAPEAKAEAEALKNEGNNLMKANQFTEALEKYTSAVALDATNAIYFCNRAAAHSSLNDNEAAIDDCKKALALNPKYARAYGRLGLALTNLDRHVEAREAYRIACQLEPQNEAYRNNLAVTEKTLSRRQPQPFPGLDSLFQNQNLANVAAQMLGDPGLQNILSRLIGDAAAPPAAGEAPPAEGSAPGGVGLDALLRAGQQLAQQMQQANPELVEQLRQQMGGGPPPQNPPPKPPQ